MATPTLGVVIVAAGSGQRLGSDEPKAFVDLSGVTLLGHALARVRELEPLRIAVVHPDGFGDRTAAICAGPDVILAVGGATRAASVRAGLAVLEGCDVVAVHDAARCLQPASVMREAVAALTEGVLAAAPALRVADTLKRTRAGSTAPIVLETVDRADLWAVQTPQVARRQDLLVAAHATGAPDATDDLGLLEWARARGLVGGDVRLVPGADAGRKITWPDDLIVAAAELARDGSTKMSHPLEGPPMRIGTGHDVHPFAEEERPLVLGGVEVDPVKGLAGHSDADVVSHAVIDAVLGATAAGDIGQRFGVDDPAIAGARSVELLAIVVAEAEAAGWVLGNLDITVLAQRPRLSPHRNAIVAGVAAAVGLPVTAVSVKFTTTDGLGAIGRGEGIMATASVLMRAV